MGFAVGPETALFLLSALILEAGICDYWANVLYQIKRDNPWSNGQTLDCPFKPGNSSMILLIVIQVLLLFGIIIFVWRWRSEVYIMQKEAYMVDREDVLT